MDEILLLGGMLLVCLVLIGIPILISWGTYKLLKKYSKIKWLRYISLAPIIVLAYFLWTSFIPTDDFYKEDFKEVLQYEFPKSAKIEYKYASFPDHFGDYTSVFVLTTDHENYNNIKKQVRKLGFTEKKDNFHSPETKEAIKKHRMFIGNEFVNENVPSKRYYVAFANDKKTVLIRRHSW